MKSFPTILFSTTAAWCLVSAAPPPEVAPSTITDTAIYQLDKRQVIIEQRSSVQLPDPPKPVERPVLPRQTREELDRSIAAWQDHQKLHPFIHAGATVYRLPNGQTITHVSSWSVNSSEPISFWSSADFSLIAHPGSFSTERGVNYTIMLMWTPYDLAQWKALMEKYRVAYQPPELPEFPDGPATWKLDESESTDEPDPAALAAIEAIHHYLNSEKEDLQRAYEKRQAEQAARRAELAANPPQPRDIHLRVTRLTPDKAKAWHEHATRQNRTVEQKGGEQ